MDKPNSVDSSKHFQVSGWLVDPDSDRLQRQDEEVKLEPKVMEVLVYFASRPGEVVTREDLERDVWKGALVGYDAVTATVIKLRKALGDNAKDPHIIATIPKKGYQLVAPVTQVENDASTTQAALDWSTLSQSPNKAGISVRTQLFVAVVGVIVIVAGWQLLDSQPGSESATVEQQPKELVSDKSSDTVPSVVVLPFKNLSDDPQQEYFSDGITDDIITDLSQVGALRVIARQSAYYYKNRNTNLDEIADDFDVQYVVEGSVQKAGKRIRINAQLTDVASGLHLWAERFDRNLGDVFAIQDEIARRVIDAMFVTLSEQENLRVHYRTTDNFEAYDTFLRGLQHSRDRTREGNELTVAAYQRAIELDPNYARVYGALAVTMTREYRYQWTDLSMEEARERALVLAKKAVSLNQTTPQIYWSLGFVHLFRKEYEEAEVATMQSIALSPNYADGYGLLAFIANWRGKAREAEKYIKKAITLNPYHTFDYPWNLGLAYYTMGRYEEAVKLLNDALDRNETVLLPRLYLAASYVRLGRLEDAEWEIEQLGILRPGNTISHLTNTLPYENENQLQAVLDDLQTAGLPVE